ncbi:hypothetical protein CIL06_21295 [Pantoea vagans]|nr:hypothetical protein CIL06_21295 [Pantoea vagans]
MQVLPAIYCPDEAGRRVISTMTYGMLCLKQVKRNAFYLLKVDPAAWISMSALCQEWKSLI